MIGNGNISMMSTSVRSSTAAGIPSRSCQAIPSTAADAAGDAAATTARCEGERNANALDSAASATSLPTRHLSGTRRRRSTVTLLCAVALVGVYLCASGLLRLDEVFTHTASASKPLESSQPLPTSNDGVGARKLYDRLVVVLIDALRADMVLGSDAMYGHTRAPSEQTRELSAHMPYAHGLVASGQALGYIAHASVPTVTMPRLKALVTGKAPAFIDILKNFNSAALAEENLVALLAASGRRIVFYGDDTWLKLFPTAFQRSDGTSGFFTRDTVEVDANVTRHLKDELDPAMTSAKSRDWDVLVLHYLGLDHVGHLRGPRSSMMVDKLHEMDAIIERVYDAVKAQDALRLAEDATALPSLVLLCSDHGMSEVGNHGGATVEESSALLLFLRGDGRTMNERASTQQRRLQVDLVPTLASVFGLRIPSYSTGRLLDEVVQASARDPTNASTLRVYVESLHQNFEQLHRLAAIKLGRAALTAFDTQYAPVLKRLEQRMQRADRGTDDATVAFADAHMLRDACSELQDRLAQSDGSEYNARAVFLGVCCLLGSAGVAVRSLRLFARAAALVRDPVAVVLVVGSVLQIMSLTSSSSIENEHASAFYLLTTALCACGAKLAAHVATVQSMRTRLVLLALVLVATRVLRSRNQVINFGRLNSVHVDSQLPGNAFANDDSLSILSTAPLFNGAVLPEAIFALICGLVSAKAAVLLFAKPASVRQPVAQLGLALATASFVLGMAGSLLCSRMARLETAATAAATSTHESSRLVASVLALTMQYSADDYARVVYAIAAFLCVALLSVPRAARLVVAEMVVWLLVTLLQRESNVPTLGVLCIQLACLGRLLQHAPQLVVVGRSSGLSLALLGLWLAQSAFFALGNSHLVTTIDISQSFHGLSGYTQSIVGFLTFVSVLSGPLVVFVNLLQWVHAAATRAADTSLRCSVELPSRDVQDVSPCTDASVSTDVCLVLFVYQTLRFAVYTIVVYFMRFHLFIWSVFAPKMLYEVVQTAVVLAVTLAVSLLTVRSTAASESRPKRL